MVDRDLDEGALHDLHEIAGCVTWREEG